MGSVCSERARHESDCSAATGNLRGAREEKMETKTPREKAGRKETGRGSSNCRGNLLAQLMQPFDRLTELLAVLLNCVSREIACRYLLDVLFRAVNILRVIFRIS